jgi:hypothetical protein
MVERNPTVMRETRNAADTVLAHSEDEGEWENEPEQIESQPSGTQVISARLPTVLAEHLLAEASNRGIRPSELVRQAVEAYMRSGLGRVASVSAQGTGNMSVASPLEAQPTMNPNLVVSTPHELELASS